MNILYFADPHSIHDIKWINYFSDHLGHQTYILPRRGQVIERKISTYGTKAVQLDPIIDFSIVRFYRTLLTATRIKATIKKYKIDMVHILYSEPNVLWCLFQFIFGVPMIVSTRGTDVLQTIPKVFQRKSLINFLAAPAYRKAFLKADWVTCTSSKQIKSVITFSGRTSHISIVRTGVDLSLIENSLFEKKSTIEGPFVLFPRLIQPVYNHEFGLQAIAGLSEDLKKKYKMVFLGKNSGNLQYQNLLEQMMRATKGVDFVFLEKQNAGSLINLYRNATVVVMTPLSDGSPVSAMEAIVCGTPVILGPIDYDQELFSESVIKLTTWNVQELIDRLTDLLTEKIKFSPVSSSVREKMDRMYNMSRLNKIYKQILIRAKK